jgi:hypothetical protein
VSIASSGGTERNMAVFIFTTVVSPVLLFAFKNQYFKLSEGRFQLQSSKT